MADPLSACVTRSIAVATVTAVVWAPATVPPASLPPTATHAIALTAAALPTTPFDPYDGPSLFDLIGHGIIAPSLGQAPPAPPPNTPIPVGSSVNQGIKNIYNTVEPWVRYGFELATYAVGWVPVVGWLSGQIMIFYNFGERIVRSITFNVADWLFGPVPFLQGLGNVARDSWNALVQLGIDEWNFFLPPLPPLPPLPFAAQQTAKVAAQVSAQPKPTAPAAGSGRGVGTKAPRPVLSRTPIAASTPAAEANPAPTGRGESTSSKTLRQTSHDTTPSKGVGRPKPR